MRAETVAQRFERTVWRGAEDECWDWPGSIFKVGYGQLTKLGKHYYAHRVSYEVHKGPIPPGMHILHSCDNKKCVNPAHLHLGTHADNMREAAERGLMKGNPLTKGTMHPLAKLTDGQVREIYASTGAGVDLARRYGVATSLISRIRTGKCWPHITNGEPNHFRPRPGPRGTSARAATPEHQPQS